MRRPQWLGGVEMLTAAMALAQVSEAFMTAVSPATIALGAAYRQSPLPRP